MNDVGKQALLDASRTISAMNLEAVITDALENGEQSLLKEVFCLEFDPLEAGYAS